MPDADLRAIAAYLKRGLKPVVNKVADSEGPPDFWASAMVPENIGIHPAAAFPTDNEQQPPAAHHTRALRGRALVIDHDCTGCHQGTSPAGKGWLAGITAPRRNSSSVRASRKKAPCFHGVLRTSRRTRPPESAAGRQQVFNALRYGLRPDSTPDVEDPVDETGQRRFPAEPKYLGPFMPWSSWRHMSDEDLWSIIAYLRCAVKPVNNTVALSDDTPDHWASAVAASAPIRRAISDGQQVKKK
jgi:hypothetical protein